MNFRLKYSWALSSKLEAVDLFDLVLDALEHALETFGVRKSESFRISNDDFLFSLNCLKREVCRYLLTFKLMK